MDWCGDGAEAASTRGSIGTEEGRTDGHYTTQNKIHKSLLYTRRDRCHQHSVEGCDRRSQTRARAESD